jgi:tape measure domain-containing protein
MDKLSWIFELVDRVSGPANSASTSLDRVDRTMRRASGTSDGFMAKLTGLGASFSRITFAVLPTIVALGQIATAGIAVGNVMRMMGVNGATLRAGFSAIRGGAARAAASLKAFGMKALEALRRIPPSAWAAGAAIAGIALAAWGAKRAVSAMLSPVRQLASMALSAAPFIAIGGALTLMRGQLDAIVDRQRFVRGFDIMLGAGQGERVTQRLVGLSDMLGVSWTEMATAGRELFSKGFGEDQAFRLLQGMSDLRAVNPTADLGRIALALGQVRNAGRLQGDELNQLAEGGLNMGPIRRRIAEAMNIPLTDFAKVQREGRITADIFMTAVEGAMAEQAGGVLGSIAEEMSHSLGGEWERLQNAPGRFFERVASQGGATTDRLAGSLRRINELLDPSTPQGQRVVAGLTRGLELLADGIEWLSNNTGEMGQAFDTLMFILTPVKWTLTGLYQMAVWLKDAFIGWSFAIGSVHGWLKATGTVVSAEVNSWQGRFQGFLVTAYSFGRDIVLGITQGLLDFAMFPATALSGMGENMLGVLRNTLGIHSPSREFAYLGAMSGEGFMQGLMGSGMQTGLEGRIQAPQLGSAAQASALMGATISVTINVDATSAESSNDIAQQIRAALMPELSAAFEALALESGV